METSRGDGNAAVEGRCLEWQWQAVDNELEKSVFARLLVLHRVEERERRERREGKKRALKEHGEGKGYVGMDFDLFAIPCALSFIHSFTHAVETASRSSDGLSARCLQRAVPESICSDWQPCGSAR